MNQTPRFNSLFAWLTWQETLHPSKIDLGLERIAAVAGRMGLLNPSCAVITIAGTNGKGSSVAMLDAICRAAGYRVGSYTSPHIHRYNERIRINGEPAADDALCTAFHAIDIARAGETLSYFEFGTLAALALFHAAAPDLILLEVGMGGRLDAVNIIDPDVALVSSIGIDHTAWLGSDREAIGREKAGIFRSGRPAICADPDPPSSLRDAAARIGARWFCLGDHFDYEVGTVSWSWHGPGLCHADLPMPALGGAHQFNNAAGVLMALAGLAERLPVPRAAIVQGLQEVVLPARCQYIHGETDFVLDVAHNPDSAVRLLSVLQDRPCHGQTYIVLGMLEDKDVGAFARALQPAADHWYLGGLDVDRGLAVDVLQERILQAGILTGIRCFPSVAAACRQARVDAVAGDRIVICGSFFAVAEARQCHV
ncbi:MAG: bifunctional tetrahydrofolate synthase/dihydrofolate synthase [Gammaproteobacteria bacterium]